jgi:hypothetical protein
VSLFFYQDNIMGLLDFIYDGYKRIVPLQVRTFGETVAGNMNPITAKNFSEKDLSDLTDSIREARSFRQGLLDYKQLNPDAVNNPNFMNQYNRYFKNPESESYFQSGGGTVDYGDINRSHIIREGRPIGGTEKGNYRSDYNPTQEAAIYNTLGRFPYTINEDGTVTIQEKYDYRGDPNTLGRMVMGDSARQVDITYKPKSRIKPTAKTREQQLRKIIEEMNREYPFGE